MAIEYPAQGTLALEAQQEISASEQKKDAAPSQKLDSIWVDIQKLDPSIRIDIRYATADNFTKAQIYDCPKCLLRPKVAKAIVKAHQKLQQQGLGLKMYDCYRPAPYQQRLWDKVPDARYVTPPKRGSQHSRGAAVDLTIVEAKTGKELEMGTPYDFFGERAYQTFTDLPDSILQNRLLLRNTLNEFGFRHIRTEWWHYSFRGASFPLADYVWPCE